MEEQNRIVLCVYFEDPFWVGVCERLQNGRLQACRFVFGAEPSEGEVYAFVCHGWQWLSFGPSVVQTAKALPRNPKRRQRAIQKQLQLPKAGTKAQQALSMQREQMAQERKKQNRLRRQTEAEMRYLQKQAKKKDKHKGH